MTKAPCIEEIRPALDALDERMAGWSFRPHRVAPGGHLQTFAGALWRRRFGPKVLDAEERLIAIDDETRVLARCSWLDDHRSRPTVLLVHGLEGSDASCYMLGTAGKALGAGWNAVRLNVRNCGGTEHLSPTLYHSGMSADLAEVVRHLLDEEGVPAVAVVGFSLGGNMALKMAGEFGDAPPEGLLAIATVSSAADLSASAARIEALPNRFYQWRFVRSLHDRLHRKAALFPGRYDTSKLSGARTIRDYDNRYIAPLFGFEDAEDYYARASAVPVMGSIRVPTLMLHAADDPFIPFTDRVRRAAESNPWIRSLVTPHGGHVGFVGADPADGPPVEDRHWAENRAVEFLRLMEYNRARLRRTDPSGTLVAY